MITKMRKMIGSGEHNLEIQTRHDESAFVSATQLHSHFSMTYLNVSLDDLETMASHIAEYVASQRATTGKAK